MGYDNSSVNKRIITDESSGLREATRNSSEPVSITKIDRYEGAVPYMYNFLVLYDTTDVFYRTCDLGWECGNVRALNA